MHPKFKGKNDSQNDSFGFHRFRGGKLGYRRISARIFERSLASGICDNSSGTVSGPLSMKKCQPSDFARNSMRENHEIASLFRVFFVVFRIAFMIFSSQMSS
jgi:hypothetical protein